MGHDKHKSQERVNLVEANIGAGWRDILAQVHLGSIQLMKDEVGSQSHRFAH